ncbi:acetyl-CoA carboxylase biotin carboxyl carrier protein [Flavobacteriaceae bacterium]|jgi:acetyl-CoA carboxylase biotin carboxyl carrier protein|nr:acetyl-CoA carboxylase biotin carboxyl carrier protein [Flavobacteriaceae bacterium]MDA8658210.1 acetyl-CoA carboxylase biotin carboxyl carrier protein [Flavobacteriaceae bacterium]MDG1191240.1 acetyl-CoA carboxylase biotin carboxyl carrier protein [Flavobacteriaceae bacterium]MDG1920153.1 acetyl-CoA carboxylase biotin carboxyl carrier protein [Flavobacteriaceae bacterium]
MDIKDIQNLIKFVAKSGAQEVKLEMEDIKITIKTGSDPVQIESSGLVHQLQAAPAPAVLAAPPVASPAEETPKKEEKQDNDDHLITIKSPIIGTFYRKSAPEKPAFVEVGDTIKEGDVLCVIEAMKLFNEIESEVSGTVVKILVDDASPVEFDQPLFVINPA